MIIDTTNLLDDFEDIQKRILNKLHGYVTLDERTSEELTDLEYDNVVTTQELQEFYLTSVTQCVSYCRLTTYPTVIIIVDETEVEVIDPSFQLGCILWCAGLVWRKYDIRSVDQIEETGSYVVSYGDQLIIDARQHLEPFKHQVFATW